MAPTIACPTCDRKLEYSPANRWRPFCSERCKTTDLGAWASNQYVIGGNSQESASPEDDDLLDGSPDDPGSRSGPSHPPPQ